MLSEFLLINISNRKFLIFFEAHHIYLKGTFLWQRFIQGAVMAGFILTVYTRTDTMLGTKSDETNAHYTPINTI